MSIQFPKRTPSGWQRFIINLLEKNPELSLADIVADEHVVLDVMGTPLTMNLYSIGMGNEIQAEGDLPVPASNEKRVIRELEQSGFSINDVHRQHQNYTGDVHLHFLVNMTRSTASDKIGKLITKFQATHAIQRAQEVSRSEWT